MTQQAGRVPQIRHNEVQRRLAPHACTDLQVPGFGILHSDAEWREMAPAEEARGGPVRRQRLRTPRPCHEELPSIPGSVLRIKEQTSLPGRSHPEQQTCVHSLARQGQSNC